MSIQTVRGEFTKRCNDRIEKATARIVELRREMDAATDIYALRRAGDEAHALQIEIAAYRQTLADIKEIFK